LGVGFRKGLPPYLNPSILVFFVIHFQMFPATLIGIGRSTMNHFEDHGLPLVQLKEQRRELIVALIGCKDPIPDTQIAEIASLQQAIAAMEAVVGDLDSQIEFSPPRRRAASAFGMARGRIVGNTGFIFGRRAVAPPARLRLAE
jgi:hypothetical protein